MSIQANINQTLSLAGMLTAMNPSVRAAAEKRRDIRNLKQKEDVLKEQYRTVSGKTESAIGKVEPLLEADDLGLESFTDLPDVERASKIEGELADVAQKQFELQPSTSSYQKALRADYGDIAGLETETSRVNKFRQNLERAKQSAQEAVQAAQEERRSSRPRRDFLQYIGEEQTNLGIPVSALAKTPEQKAAIRGAYTKQEKTKIMNEMEEKKSGK